MLLLTGYLLHSPVAYVRAQPVAEQVEPASAAALHWVRLAGAEDCIGGDELERAVGAKLERNRLTGAGDAPVLIEGHVEGSAGAYRASIRTSGPDGKVLGTREIRSTSLDCKELSETMTLVLAIMIDPEAVAQHAERVATPPPPVAESAPVERTLAQHAYAFARVALNLAPGAPPGLGAAYEVELPARWGALRVEGVGFLESEIKTRPDPQSAQVRHSFQLAYGGVAYCPIAWVKPRTRLTGCLSAELGALHARALDGGQRDRSKTNFWASTSAGTHLGIRIVGAFEAQLGASFGVALKRGEYRGVASNTQQFKVYDQEPIGGVLDVGIGARF